MSTSAAPRAATVLIASWLEADLVQRIRSVDARVEVIYEPDLLRPPRYSADHKGVPVIRSDDGEARWRALLARATVLFDFDQTHLDDLPELTPNLEWIQATSAGIGQLVRRRGYAERMPHVVLTTARGVHAKPLAEFALMAMLAHTRRLGHMVLEQSAHRWERFAGTDLEGHTVAVVGLGAVGREVARLAKAFGTHVIGVKRTPGSDPAALHADELHSPDALLDVLARTDFLVLAAPHTDETEGMIGRRELETLSAGAVLINVGRGALVDEPALIDALDSGHLAGAHLDVFAEEPLPADSPLWDHPNVLVSPHSASTSDRENGRITDLFCENLRRYLSGEELLNVLEPGRLY